MNKKELKYLALITVVFLAAAIETDIYLPAFPDMMVFFKVSEDTIQSLLSWNFFGICISGPIYGPVSDAYGRKKPLMIALTLFLIGSILTVFADDFSTMLVGRLLQGLGSGGCFTLGSTIVFDVFRGERAIQISNKLNSIVPLIMAGAPFVGGYLNLAFGFRSNFFLIGAVVLISFFICLIFLEESLPEEKHKPLSFGEILVGFKTAFTSWGFWHGSLAISLIFAAYLAFVSGISVLFMIEFGVSKAIFPLYQASLLGSFVIASLTCDRAIRKWGLQGTKKKGIAYILLGGVTFVIAAVGWPENAIALTTTMVIYSFGAGWLIGPYFGEAMEALPQIKGITASLLTSARLLFTAIVIGIASDFYNATIFPLVWVVSGCVLIVVLMHWFSNPKKVSS